MIEFGKNNRISLKAKSFLKAAARSCYLLQSQRVTVQFWRGQKALINGSFKLIVDPLHDEELKRARAGVYSSLAPPRQQPAQTHNYAQGAARDTLPLLHGHHHPQLPLLYESFSSLFLTFSSDLFSCIYVPYYNTFHIRSPILPKFYFNELFFVFLIHYMFPR